MITLKRIRTGTYKCSTGLVPLVKVANSEKKMSDEFISSESNFVTEEFCEYVRPLIGGELLSYVYLE